MELTITEALQEIKTLKQRIIKKRMLLGNYIGRDARMRDPFEAQGGSEKYVKEERQSTADLEQRLISLRVAIQHTNLVQTIEGDIRTVAVWLTWRREVAPLQKEHLEVMRASIKRARQQLQSKGGKLIAATAVSGNVNMDASAPPEFIINLDEQQLLKDIERMEKLLGTLDGRLSLFNATHTVTVA